MDRVETGYGINDFNARCNSSRASRDDLVAGIFLCAYLRFLASSRHLRGLSRCVLSLIQCTSTGAGPQKECSHRRLACCLQTRRLMYQVTTNHSQRERKFSSTHGASSPFQKVPWCLPTPSIIQVSSAILKFKCQQMPVLTVWFLPEMSRNTILP